MLKFPKPVPALIEKTQKQLAVASLEASENAEVRFRSGGVCEVTTLQDGVPIRCRRRATDIHHMIGGWGRRGRGISALALHKQHVCRWCHREISGHVLQHVGCQVPVFTDRYRRVVG